MPEPETRPLSEDDHAKVARLVMRRQGALSLRVAGVFLTMLLGLPLVNAFLPNLANAPIFGFTASWLVLGVLSFPVTVLLSVYFVRESDRIEAACSDWRAMLDEAAIGDERP